ncbi:Pectinesterase QRT1 [Camellia lanceoleosa]|uniref:Pectinesterase QRT1 n=1 Tax=Camellia lanceoleosa TaxID=1840588 RepID=A0ACC0H8L6_9ERIC|nr:Pectinesterase QRT1 [Camellia lanceoleosa]
MGSLVAGFLVLFLGSIEVGSGKSQAYTMNYITWEDMKVDLQKERLDLTEEQNRKRFVSICFIFVLDLVLYLRDHVNKSEASPYMKIKFNNIEQPLNLLCTKGHFQTLPRTEQLKRMKLTCLEACSVMRDFSILFPYGIVHVGLICQLLFQTNGGRVIGDECEVDKEETLPQEVEEVKPQICSDHLATTINWEVNDGTSLEEGSTELAKERTNKIMQNFAKALWNVLKQYKGKLEIESVLIQLYAHRGDAVLDLACGKVETGGNPGFLVLFLGSIEVGSGKSQAYTMNYITWEDMKVDLQKERLDLTEEQNRRQVIIVDQNGKGDSVTVQGAVDMVPLLSSQRVKIYIHSGI